MMNRQVIYAVFICVCLFINNVKSNDCNLNKASDNEKKLLERLNPIKGNSYSANDNEFGYYFRVCDVPDQATNKTSLVGFVQKSNQSEYVLGRLSDVDLEGGQGWIRLTYKNGDTYAQSCGRTKRKAVVFILCDDDSQEDKFSKIEENNNREDDCGYIFELSTSKICPKKDSSSTLPPTSVTCKVDAKKSASSSSPSGLGIFGIVLLCIFSVVAVYFVVGILYLRFIRQARGWQQVPNFRFWNKFGNLQADMCDYICRCGGGENDLRAQPYESLTGQLSDDENMLNV